MKMFCEMFCFHPNYENGGGKVLEQENPFKELIFLGFHIKISVVSSSKLGKTFQLFSIDLSLEAFLLKGQDFWKTPWLGGGFEYLSFSPLPGEDEPILTHIFQWGWNHQLDELSNIDDPFILHFLLFRRGATKNSPVTTWFRSHVFEDLSQKSVFVKRTSPGNSLWPFWDC